MEGRCKCRKETEEKKQKRAGLKSSQHFQDISKHLFLRQFFKLVQYVLHVLLAQTCFNVDDSKGNVPKTIPGLICSQLPLSTLLIWFMLKNMMGDIWDVYCEWSLAYPHSWTAKGRARPLHPTPEAESMLTRRQDRQLRSSPTNVSWYCLTDKYRHCLRMMAERKEKFRYKEKYEKSKWGLNEWIEHGEGLMKAGSTQEKQKVSGLSSPWSDRRGQSRERWRQDIAFSEEMHWNHFCNGNCYLGSLSGLFFLLIKYDNRKTGITWIHCIYTEYDTI